MCGFVGVWRPPGAPPAPPGPLAAALGRLWPRGPDQRGSVCRGRFALAAARLAVRGGRESDQPLGAEDSGWWLAYNGEVLPPPAPEPLGADTPALLAALAGAGPGAALARLDGGMGAFAAYDERGQRLYLARDALGIKPLYYARTREGGVAFASTLAALFAVAPEARALDLAGFAELVAWHRPRTRLPFAGVAAVDPGVCLAFAFHPDGRLGATPVARLAPPLATAAAGGGPAELWAALAEAAPRAARAEGGATLLLSGGLDSAAVLAAAGPAVGGALTGRFDPAGGPLDESPAAAAVAGALGRPHTVVPLADAELVDALPAVAAALEVPLAGPGALALWLLAPHAARRGKVLLSGTGGDEWLGGYARTALALGRAGPYTAGYEALAADLLVPGLGEAERLVRAFDRSAVLGPLLHPDLRAALPAPEPPRVAPGETLWQALRREEVEGTLAALLHVEDRVFMAHGVEARPVLCLGAVPRVAAGLGLDALIGPDGEGKRALRAALVGRIPEAVRTDPRKRGFPTPFARAARGAGRARVRAWVADPAFARRGWWDARAVGALLDAERPAHDRALYSLLLIEWWARHFLDAEGRHGEAASR